MIKYFLLVVAIGFFLIGQLVNADTFEVESLKEFQSAVYEYVKANPESKVLVVFDIDDTLLESEMFFGGDTWFNWQNEKKIMHVNGKLIEIDTTADRLKCLFDKLGIFYEISRYHVTEGSVPLVVSQLQDNFDVMALTSRSPGYRSATERELNLAGVDFAKSHLMKKDTALAFDFTAGRTAPVGYQNGIVMSTGLNKGKVLEELLEVRLEKYIGEKYTAIFFVDDGESNIDNMEAVWNNENKETRVYSYLYKGVHKVISDEKIEQARESREALNTFLKTAFPKRFQEFSSEECN